MGRAAADMRGIQRLQTNWIELNQYCVQGPEPTCLTLVVSGAPATSMHAIYDLIPGARLWLARAQVPSHVCLGSRTLGVIRFGVSRGRTTGMRHVIQVLLMNQRQPFRIWSRKIRSASTRQRVQVRARITSLILCGMISI
jgi:hypothetical protein